MKHLKALLLGLAFTLALAASASAIDKVPSGFRLLNGDTINQLIDAVSGTSNGAYKGTFNGTLGATTPSTVAATTGAFSSTLGVTGAATFSSTTAHTGLATFSGHIAGGGTAPALTACGTSPSISGTDLAGTVTMGTGTPTGCVITFNVTYGTAPHCAVTWRATPLASQSYTISATAITLTQTATDSNLVDYVCVK